MNTFEMFESICRAMAVPSFYPHRVSGLERRDTHISAVFLTGEWVYKLKKPVNFGFLNFETREARKACCLQEVVLNQRLTTGVYDSVVDICEGAEGCFNLGGPGRVVDHVVKMRQLPDAGNLEALLARGEITDRHMESLGRKLADFYANSIRSEAISRFGDPRMISFNMEENFIQVEPYVGRLFHQEKWDFIRESSRAFFRNHDGNFKKRVRLGRIRDGHGDLRAEHVYFSDGIQIIDCIEFNDRFRYGDVASDIAFLYMDLDRLGHLDLGCAFLNAVTRFSGDFGLYGFIDFYAAYRAVVKLKVACLSAGEGGLENYPVQHRAAADRYLQQAYRYAVGFSRPTLWVFCGLPASGKSTLAERLSDTLSVALIQSDRVRKQEAGVPIREKVVVPFGSGIYKPVLRHRTYAHMLLAAQERLENGRSAILDGTYSHRKWRDDARRLAEDLDSNIIFVETTASREHLIRRLQAREKKAGISDARLQHLDAILAEFEPLAELDASLRVTVSTESDPDEAFSNVMAQSHDRKCAQIRKLPTVASMTSAFEGQFDQPVK